MEFDYKKFMEGLISHKSEEDIPKSYMKMYENLNYTSVVGDVDFSKYSLRQFERLRDLVEELESKPTEIRHIKSGISKLSPIRNNINFI